MKNLASTNLTVPLTIFIDVF